MRVAVIDSATPAITAAVAVIDDDESVKVLAERVAVDGRAHGELLAPALHAALAEAGLTMRDLDAVVAGLGPGPFTGLRVGLVTARTLGLALDVPVYGVCTLDVLAAEAVDTDAVHGPFLVATDARRKEVYWASYDETGARLDGPHVARPADVATDAPVVGAGARLYPEAFPHAVGPEHPDARVLARVVTDERVELLDPEPLYLRRPDVAAPGARKPVS
jgi:tRNA threonylcarbamoyl adenosine modification protein YeaZ